MSGQNAPPIVPRAWLLPSFDLPPRSTPTALTPGGLDRAKPSLTLFLAPSAFQELAATGQAPVVLQDCLRWLALRGLTTPRLFAGTARSEDRKLAALRHLYDTGRRPLRSKSCRDKEPHVVGARSGVCYPALCPGWCLHGSHATAH